MDSQDIAPVEAIEGDPALGQRGHELGQHVDRQAQQVEIGHADEGRLGVQDVGAVEEDVGGERGDGHQEGGAGPETDGEGTNVGDLGRNLVKS